MRLVDAEQRALLIHSVLENRTVQSWAQERRITPVRAMAALVQILDELVDHFRS
jgi:hypothetical protein